MRSCAGRHADMRNLSSTAYCWGNFAGPFVVKQSEAPDFPSATIGLLVGYAIKLVCHLCLLGTRRGPHCAIQAAKIIFQHTCSSATGAGTDCMVLLTRSLATRLACRTRRSSRTRISDMCCREARSSETNLCRANDAKGGVLGAIGFDRARLVYH